MKRASEVIDGLNLDQFRMQMQNRSDCDNIKRDREGGESDDDTGWG